MEFDENKKITKSIDYDKKYKFKPSELIEKDYKEIDLWVKYIEISRTDYKSKFYQGYQEDNKKYETFKEYIPIKKRGGGDLELYFIETINLDKNSIYDGTKIELIINAQTGKIMLYGDYRIYLGH